MANCHNCGADVGDTAKFCRECGTRIEPAAEQAATWRLPSGGGPGSPGPQATSPVRTTTTGEPRGVTGPAYTPPAGYYSPAPLATMPKETRTPPPTVSLGQWLSEGWQLYKQNWLIMSLAAMFGAFLSACSVGILTGPMLMGLFRMAFRTMRGERPEMGDLFKWEGKFFQAFLAALAFGAIYFTLIGVGGKIGLFAILKLLIGPLITIGLGLTLPLILERGKDVAAAINEVAHLIYKREGLMWWVTGLVFSTIIAAGLFGCGIGIFVTAPWIICASAVAYRHFFGVDDPNRTLP